MPETAATKVIDKPPTIPLLPTCSLDGISLDDALLVWQMAKYGVSVAGWHPSPRMVSAYKRVQAILQETGRLPK